MNLIILPIAVGVCTLGLFVLIEMGNLCI
jgi:hypothetical protein